MKRFCAFLAMMLMLQASCSVSENTDTPTPQPPVGQQPDNDNDNNNEADDSNNGGNGNENNDNGEMNMKITVTVGGQEFAATLADTSAAREFAALLPLTLRMDELNGNEKFCYTGHQFTTEPYRPGTIREGDILLYGNDCVVLFYETFASSYSYTRIGSLDSPSGIAEAVGSGSVTVVFAAE